MKILAAILLLLAWANPGRADILTDSNFTEGRAHWKGDAKDMDRPELATSTPPGITVTLSKDRYTKIYQTFSTSEKSLQCSVTFTLSSDYQIPPTGGGGETVTQTPGLDDIDGTPPLGVTSYYGGWCMVVQKLDGTASKQVRFLPDPTNTTPQTLTSDLKLSTTDELILVLAFPPGQGTITLTNLSLKPFAGQPEQPK